MFSFLGGGSGDPVVELKPPVSERKLLPSLKEGGRLQCGSPLREADCRVVDAFLGRHPAVCLRAMLDGGADLSFLRHVPSLRDAWVSAMPGTLNDLAPLQHLSAGLRALVLDTLEVGGDKARDQPKANAQELARFAALAELCVCGALKDLGFLTGLAQLQRLRLWRNKLKSLAGIEALRGLLHLELKSSGARDLGPVGELGELRSLDVWDQRGIEGLEALARLPKLSRLWLMSCGKGLPLPSFAGFASLRVLVLHSMADRASIEAVASAPALRCLILSNAIDANWVEALRPLAGHPSLREVRIDDSERSGPAITSAYGWKVAFPNFPADEYL